MNYLFHRRVYMQGVLEFTNHCPRNCFYCDLREENRDKKRFRLNSEEIRGALKEGYELGLRSFILESGEDHYYTDIIMGNLISTLKGEFPDCALGLSIGERSRLSYSRMKKNPVPIGISCVLKRQIPCTFQDSIPRRIPYQPK